MKHYSFFLLATVPFFGCTTKTGTPDGVADAPWPSWVLKHWVWEVLDNAV